jgi:LEA14-like dessication related protein
MAALVPWLLSGCAQLKPEIITPTVRVADFRVVELGLLSGRAEIGLVVDNPNPMGFQANGFTYRVMLGGTQIADTRSDRKLDIAASGKTLVNIPVEFSYQGLITGLQNMMNTQELDYEVSGKIFTTLMDFPFSKKDTLSFTQPQGR